MFSCCQRKGRDTQQGLRRVMISSPVLSEHRSFTRARWETAHGCLYEVQPDIYLVRWMVAFSATSVWQLTSCSSRHSPGAGIFANTGHCCRHAGFAALLWSWKNTRISQGGAMETNPRAAMWRPDQKLTLGSPLCYKPSMQRVCRSLQQETGGISLTVPSPLVFPFREMRVGTVELHSWCWCWLSYFPPDTDGRKEGLDVMNKSPNSDISYNSPLASQREWVKVLTSGLYGIHRITR